MKISNKQNSTSIFSLRNLLILFFLGILVCGVTGYVMILRSCFFLNCVEARSFNVLDLELPSDLFPAGAIVNPIHRPSTSEGAFEKGFMSFRWRGGNGRATYTVWRFRTEEEASDVFTAESGEAVYVEDQDFFHQSAIADEFAIGCGKPQYSRYRCNMAARYQEYAIHLNAIIDGDMSTEMFNETVIFTDREIEQRLYSHNEE